MNSGLRETPLHSRHVQLGAKTADFGGWDMPIEYAGVLVEHDAVRSAVGIFDVSHMGKVRIHGDGALAYLNSVLTNDLDRIPDGSAQYTMLCNEFGGVVDDLIVYRWSDDEIFMVPNASNASVIVELLRESAPAGVTIENHHDTHGIIAVQGPNSRALLEAIGLPAELDYMSMISASHRGEPVIVCRSGYTGELGFELVLPNIILGSVWDVLLERGHALGAVPAGLGARDTLRLEMGYPLHGQDIAADISPVEAGLSWAVGWDKPQFAGREALLKQREAGPRRKLRGLKSVERGIPRAHMHVHGLADVELAEPAIGDITSGTYSPSLKCGIALALLDADIEPGYDVLVDVRGKPIRFQVVKPPFMAPSTR
ncbi:MAG TPA: glycine cleavage system aminomethyltransferase GcvT [Actinobacteria bacterium]|nr:glycine cleavage system aminomethyltransferase GcvT [Actinomycetota bacterium]